jgi:leucyl/phenylalanyl-tRNA--protein transferase
MSYFPYDVARIFLAYTTGEFPTLNQRGEFILFRPRTRAVFPASGMHVSKTLAQTIRKDTFRVTFDQAFLQVMHGCVRESENWITPELMRMYHQIHKRGWAHSVECWQGETLAGGLYGLAIGGVFFIESMFSHANDASKVATKHLIDECQRQGFTLIDAQLMSPHLASIGAVEISDDTFQSELNLALSTTTAWGRNRSDLGAAISPPTIATERLLIRGLDEGDAARYFAYQCDPDVSRFTLVYPPASIADARSRIVDHAWSRYREGTPDPLAICLQEDPETLIGTVGCYRPTPLLSQMEISYDLDRKFWGRGYAREAAASLISHVFANFAVERIQARTVVENAPGDALNRRLGMTYEGLLRSAMYHQGRFWDLRYYSLLRSEWPDSL